MAIAFQVAMDCADPHAQADFWAAALGYVVPDVQAGIEEVLAQGFATEADITTHRGRTVWRTGAACEDPDGVGPRMYFQQVPEGKVAKNRVHLDLRFGPDRIAAEVERLRGLGATFQYEASQGPHSWVTMTDPEGNEFCVS
jgi:hypothetical protein